MTTTVTTTRTTNTTVVYVVVTAALASGILATAAWPIISTQTYGWVLTGLLAAAATAPAIIDARTLRLPNVLVAPIASAALIQAIAISIRAHDLAIAWIPIAAAIIVGTLYLLMGLARWCGFGDVTFAAALALPVAIYAGFASIYLVGVALMISSAQIALSKLLHHTHRRAHGPALAIAALAVLAVAVALHPAGVS